MSDKPIHVVSSIELFNSLKPIFNLSEFTMMMEIILDCKAPVLLHITRLVTDEEKKEMIEVLEKFNLTPVPPEIK